MFLTLEQFILEKQNHSDLHKIYAVVDTSNGHEWAKEEGAKAFIVINQDNIDEISSLDPLMPILNYSIKLIEKLKKKGIKNYIYNDVATIQVSSSKKKFHEKLGNHDNIPTTVYSEKDISKVGFPLIAKPKKGHSGVGIQIFKSEKEFNEADQSQFDVYSQYIDKKSEHRIINFNGKPFVWMERKPLNDKAKTGDGDSKGKMEFKYIKRDPKDLPENFAKVNSKFCKTFNQIPLICFDVMEDQDGKVYIIESNTMTGMPFDISLELYRLMFKDAYGTDMNPESVQELNRLSKSLIDRTLKRESKKWEIEKKS